MFATGEEKVMLEEAVGILCGTDQDAGLTFNIGSLIL